MSRYSKKTDDVQPLEPKSQKCIAHGCPLLGTMSNSLNGSDQWYCRFHNGRDVSQFDKVSLRINLHLALINHANRVERAGPCVCDADPARYYNTGNAAYSKRPGEKWTGYVRRLNAMIHDAIHGGGAAETETEEAA